MSKHSSLDTLARFAVHTVVGSALVIIIALCAHGVHLFLNWLKPTTDPVLISTLVGLKYGILGSDVIVATATVLNGTRKALLELWEGS